MVYYISMLSTTGGKLKVSPKKILENYNKVKKINKSKNLVKVNVDTAQRKYFNALKEILDNG